MEAERRGDAPPSTGRHLHSTSRTSWRCKANKDEATRANFILFFFKFPESYLKFSLFLYLKEHFLPRVALKGFRAAAAAAAKAVFQSDHLLKRCPTGPRTQTQSR